MSEVNNPPGTLALYAAGGCGINIVKKFQGFESDGTTAHIHPCYIDTSDSNLAGLDSHGSDTYLLPDVDGSGKVRRENYTEISARMKEISGKFKPMDMNVVVFSGSGGSGSVISPLLIKELLEKQQPVIAIMVTSSESQIAATNTLNTLKTLDSISRKIDMPIICSIESNSTKGNLSAGRADVDKAIESTITLIATLVARNHAELDRADIKSWVQFNKSTSVGASFALLDVLIGEDTLDEIQYPISIASLICGDTSVDSAGADYHCAGYVSEQAKKHLTNQNVHFVISTTDVPSLFKSVGESVDHLQERSQQRPKLSTFVSKADNVEDDGFIL